MIDRKTGNILDLLSASGGLMRALYMLGFLSISPYTKYVLRSHLARTLVRYVPSTSPNLPEANLDEEELHRQSTVKSLARH